ncbi:MAG: DUF1844 domain-containing protein [Verrucomicrobiota bacterium]
MNTENPAENPATELSAEDAITNLFANLVIQQTNMAFMFLGRVPHPETGEVIQDLESARFFIDQLEMIEMKTRGNLEKREEGLLKQSLTGLRMAFVEAMDGKGPAPLESAHSVSPPEAAAPIETPAPSEVPAESKPAAPAEESRKKFSKKY